VGPQTDLYSVGCIAYELLVGEPPFTSANLSELIDAHLTLAPEPLRNRASDVPVELERLVLRLLTKDPAHRPASALDVREQLERIQANLIVSPTRPTSIPRGADVVPTRVHTVSHDTAENPAYVPASPRWPLALGALTVLSLTGLAAWRWWPTETPVVEAPRLPEPVVQPTEPPAVMPVAVEPGPKPEPIKEPPVVTPPVTARAPRHSGADVKKRWLELDQRSKTLEDDLRRSARLQLDQARHCTAPAEQCWRDLGEIEELFFRK
jgi:serine/threonine protein kinase